MKGDAVCVWRSAFGVRRGKGEWASGRVGEWAKGRHGERARGRMGEVPTGFEDEDGDEYEDEESLLLFAICYLSFALCCKRSALGVA